MENIVLGMLLGAALIGFVAMIVISVRVAFVVAETLVIVKTMYIELNKIAQMSLATMQASETFVDALSEAARDQNRSIMPPFLQVYKSEDGKHSAPTFEGLIQKMKGDPSYKEMTEQDVDELRKLFEDESDDDNEEPNEPWKGDK